mmetsp:Transcript_15475/g.17194  ORF Transcript_15475/g.17194 Transcript_15475/m.17194 type:complete len:165 (+) Transcript_15475:15-509(+)
MPRGVDTSYNNVLSQPEFYDEAQREKYLQKRIMKSILEPAVPPLPNRQQELDYMKELESEFRQDRWIHTRFRKLQAGPLRKPYIKSRTLLQRERFEYGLNFVIGAILSTPVAILIGRRARLNRTGVSKIYFPVSMNRFPNVNPDVYSARFFKLYYIMTLLFGGG